LTALEAGQWLPRELEQARAFAAQRKRMIGALLAVVQVSVESGARA